MNTLAVNPHLPTCNLYARRCVHSLSELCWNADSTEIWILIWLGVRVGVWALEPISVQAGGRGNWCKRRWGVEEGAKGDGEVGGWRLPAALSPTGSNLEQTAPNVFIRLWLGWTQVGRACPARCWIVLIVPSIKRHLFRWGRAGEAGGRRRLLPVKSQLLWYVDTFAYYQGKIRRNTCILGQYSLH